MHCSNPDCRNEAQDLSRGTLRLLEMEVPPEERVTRSDYGFPVVAAPAKHFWLCAACARLFRLMRWTSAGLVLEPFRPGADKVAPQRVGLHQQPGTAGGKLALENVA